MSPAEAATLVTDDPSTAYHYKISGTLDGKPIVLDIRKSHSESPEVKKGRSTARRLWIEVKNPAQAAADPLDLPDYPNVTIPQAMVRAMKDVKVAVLERETAAAREFAGQPMGSLRSLESWQQLIDQVDVLRPGEELVISEPGVGPYGRPARNHIFEVGMRDDNPGEAWRYHWFVGRRFVDERAGAMGGDRRTLRGLRGLVKELPGGISMEYSRKDTGQKDEFGNTRIERSPRWS